MEKNDYNIKFDRNIYTLETELKIVNVHKCSLEEIIAASNCKNEIIKQIGLIFGPISAGIISGNFNNNPNHAILGGIFSTFFLADLAITGLKKDKSSPIKDYFVAKKNVKNAIKELDEYLLSIDFDENDLGILTYEELYIKRNSIAKYLYQLIDGYLKTYNIKNNDIKLSEFISIINRIYMSCYRYDNQEDEFFNDMYSAVRAMVASAILYEQDNVQLYDFIYGLQFISNPYFKDSDLELIQDKLYEEYESTYKPNEKNLHM